MRKKMKLLNQQGSLISDCDFKEYIKQLFIRVVNHTNGRHTKLQVS